jgi:hypothetical protein
MTEEEKCPICKGTGFMKGKICVCISGKSEPIEYLMDLPEDWDEIFGNLFKNPKSKKRES